MGGLRDFMTGRNGFDKLNIVFTVFFFILAFTGRIFAFFKHLLLLYYICALLCLLLMILIAFRTFSTNLVKRHAENAQFLKNWDNVSKWFHQTVTRFTDKQNRYFPCPSCGLVLRVPRGKGKIEIFCPKCHTKFIKKT